MGLSIHTNYASLVTQNQLGRTNNSLATAMERLGTGYRINSAADDAAGLQISNRLESQSRGLGVAARNSQDAISMMQTGEGALEELTNIVFRMKDLAIQAANGVNGTTEFTALNAEYGELGAEFTRILDQTTYGSGQALLRGGSLAAAIQFQIGASATETLTVNIGANITALPATAAALGTVGTAAGATAAITALDTVLTNVGAARSALGANINRLEHTINNLTSIVENTDTAKGRITDADFAVETSHMTKQQMLLQAGMSVLSQSNQMSGLVTSLLR
jgi:flagellin